MSCPKARPTKLRSLSVTCKGLSWGLVPAGLRNLFERLKIFVGRGPGRAGIFDFSHDIRSSK
jgi:hypothetical protein